MSEATTPGTRRGFLRSASTGLALGLPAAAEAQPVNRKDRLPREVWVASIAQEGLHARNHEQMIKLMLARMEETLPYEPDIVCLPEVFPFANLASGRPPLSEVAEKPIGPVCDPFAAFAKKNNCYVVCATYTKENGRYYNSAVLLDRAGKVVGEYRKIHPTVSEMERGISPGPLEPPVFQTDFGTIGCQICYDINWPDGWRRLRKAGAEMVFWPSAFAGGSMVNAMAWRNKYCVVSSTRKLTTRICDISGADIAWTGWVQPWLCAPVNLEKAFVHSWPYSSRYKDIQAKYGRDIRITVIYEEEWSIIESRSPDVKIADVLKEFEIPTHEEHIATADAAQMSRRRS